MHTASALLTNLIQLGPVLFSMVTAMLVIGALSIEAEESKTKGTLLRAALVCSILSALTAIASLRFLSL